MGLSIPGNVFHFQETPEELAKLALVAEMMESMEWVPSTTMNGHQVFVNRFTDEVVFNRPSAEERAQRQKRQDTLNKADAILKAGKPDMSR